MIFSKSSLLFLLLLFLGLSASSQPRDPEKKASLLKIWKVLYKSDLENNRGAQNDSINLRNVIQSCQLIEKYGYPTEEEYGRTAGAPWSVWVHANKSYEQKEATFNIVLKGREAGEIDDEWYYNYFLRILYERKFPWPSKNKKNPTKTDIKQRLKEINPVFNKSFDYKKIKEAFDSCLVYNDLIEKHVVGIWTKKPNKKNSEKRLIIEIIHWKQRYFLVQKIATPRLYELSQPEINDTIGIRFDLKYSIEGEYIEISDTGDLFIKNKSEEIIRHDELISLERDYFK